MFVQRIGQFSASRALAALVRRFPWSRAFLPGFHVFSVLAMFLQRIGQFSASRARPALVWTFSVESGVFARFPRFQRIVHVCSTYWPVFSVARTCCASLDVFHGVGRFCPVSTFWRSVHVCSTYWPVFSAARTCCASLDVFRGVGRFCPVSTFWRIGHVCST